MTAFISLAAKGLYTERHPCFTAGQTIAAVTSQFAFSQLWNPAGSGKNLVLVSAHMFNASNSRVPYSAVRHTSAYSDTPAEGGTPYDLSALGAVSVASLRSQSTAAPVSALITSWVCRYAFGGTHEPSTALAGFQMLGGYIVRPGSGLAIFCEVTNQTVYSSFRWEERGI